MRFQKLDDWLQWIEACHPTEIDLGLARVNRVAEALHFNFQDTQVVTVAGTNGKGSCVAALVHILCAAGYRVGCYTSPHFLHYNERVQLNGEPVADSELLTAFDRIDQARDGETLTYFEFGTLAALDIFARNALDVVILEVGLGGRLDAVNIIDCDIAVITSIALDHQDWLGSDLQAIGREKAGICRAGKPVVCGPDMPASVLSYCRDIAAPVWQQDEDFFLQPQRGDELQWRSSEQSWLLPYCQLPLVSVATALQVLQLLPLAISEQHCQSLASAQLTGRFQCLCYEGKSLILDVAHNPASAQLLASRLAQTASGGRTLAVVAIMADKDILGIVQPLLAQIDAWMLADLPNNARALPAVKLGDRLAEQGVAMISVSKNVRQAFRRALSLMSENDRLVVFGSFFTVTEALKLLERKASQAEALS